MDDNGGAARRRRFVCAVIFSNRESILVALDERANSQGNCIPLAPFCATQDFSCVLQKRIIAFTRNCADLPRAQRQMRR